MHEYKLNTQYLLYIYDIIPLVCGCGSSILILLN